MWNIVIEEKAKEYLRKKKLNDIFIEPVTRRACYNTYDDFTVSTKLRDKNLEFQDVLKDGITVHICEEFRPESEKITVGCDKFMMFERLFLKNINYELNRTAKP